MTMAIFLLLLLAFVAFAVYRYKKYQKQRDIEEMAAEAQAYVSAEVVVLLQRYKALMAQSALSPYDAVRLQKNLNNLTENLLCHTDSEASVREYLALAKQDIALIKIKLDQVTEQNHHHSDNAFDALK